MQQMGVTTMEQIKKFLRSRGFTLALLACLVAAAAAGVWAVRTVRDELPSVCFLPIRGKGLEPAGLP